MSRYLTLLLCLCVMSFVGSETPSAPIFYGTIAEPTRTQLMRAWTDDFRQVERAWCVTGYDTATLPGDDHTTIVTVHSIVPAEVHGATNEGIAQVICGKGQPTIHTHPPLTCPRVAPDSGVAILKNTCYYGGPNAFSCQASRADYEATVTENTPFGVIQCDRHAFVFYWRRHYTLDKSDLM